MAIKILIGGSPCTYWSIAQKNNRETEASGMGWELFKNYLIAKEKFKPDFFLYENNKSAAQAIKDQIAEEFGVGVDPDVRFTYINSALVSAQNRQRFYVTNFGDIKQPEDRGILLKDILETGRGFGAMGEKTFALTATYGKGDAPDRILEKHQRTMVCEPVIMQYPRGKNEGGAKYDKAPTLTRSSYQTNNHVVEPVATENMTPPCDPHGRDKSRTITAGYQICSQRDLRMDIESDGFLGKQGVIEAVEVTATPSVFAPVRVPEYGSDNKSRPVRASYAYKGSGEGSLLTEAFPENPNKQVSDYVAEPVGCAFPCEWDENGTPTKAVSCADGKTYPVYEVRDGQITINGKQYPIKLPDGYYIIRKLMVKECARLQTMPDDYCKAVSDSQAYKVLGNGWTAEVIIHLLNHALKDVPRDEEIVVLSMYDGIATGRYCLDKMGFTNVKYHAYEIDKYPIQVAMDNYPDIIQHGDAFAVREDDWNPPQTQSEWLDELLGA